MKTRQLFDYKKCPRCNYKLAKSANICPNCELNYTKFEFATNKEAKEALKLGEKSRVIYRKGYPKDVSKTKLLLLSIFLGFMGAHLYYVGRWKRAVFYTVFFVVAITYSSLNAWIGLTTENIMIELFYILYLVFGVVLILWIVDIVKITFNKFRIPVSLKNTK